jgi:AcrR family transcriptional regulator
MSSKVSTSADISGGAPADRAKADILKIAMEEFAEKGLSGARVDEIAEKTATSKRMIYYYFGGKEGLYQAVLDLCYGGIRELETRGEHQKLPPEQALIELCNMTFDYHAMHPEFVRMVMNENILKGVHIGKIDSIRKRSEVIIRNLKDLLDQGVTAGVFREGIDPVELHMSLSALCFHTVSNRHTFSTIFDLDMQSPEFLEQRKKTIADTIVSWVRKQTE